MMKYMNKMMKFGLVAVLFAVAFASCVPYEKMLYLKGTQIASENVSKEYVNDRTIDYKLQPGDNLYIRFLNTIDERSAASLTGENNNTRATQTANDAGIYLHSYTLDQNGQIELPLTGKINLLNLTVDEAKERIQTEINKYVNQTTIIVKLSNFNLSVLGEVTRPGMYKVYQQQINLFEAVALAGNMTSFAKRDEVKIIRQTDNGAEIVTIDMGQADILTSPYYFLKPNDIIYVEPLKIKQWGFTTFPYSTVFSIISLAATLYLAFRPYVNN